MSMIQLTKVEVVVENANDVEYRKVVNKYIEQFMVDKDDVGAFYANATNRYTTLLMKSGVRIEVIQSYEELVIKFKDRILSE